MASVDISHTSANSPNAQTPQSSQVAHGEHDIETEARTGHDFVDNDISLNLHGTAPLPLRLNQNCSKKWFLLGCLLVILDMFIMPIVYFYTLYYRTSWCCQDDGLQYVLAIVTSLCGFTGIHLPFRSTRLFFKKKLKIYGPIGWTRWGVLEFLNLNYLIVTAIFEITLVVGTAPTKPFVKLCAMAIPSVSYYLGFLFLLSSVMTSLRLPLPFNMSSTPKGSLWRPALYTFVEDFMAVEMSGGKSVRMRLARRYEKSSMFRRMFAVLSWGWGVGLLVAAIVATVLVSLLPDIIGFGIVWFLPFFGSIIMLIVTAIFVKWSVRREAELWRVECQMEATP